MSKRVLVVDDSPAMRKMIIKVIQMSGFETAGIEQASDGQAALRLLRAEPFDLVLTDINMPVMSGEEMLEVMAIDDHLNQLPVVVISTDATDVRMDRMKNLGAKGYVAKPFSPALLRTELERVLEVPHV
jgi:two-component system chemotaxis response regulator CheY